MNAENQNWRRWLSVPVTAIFLMVAPVLLLALFFITLHLIGSPECSLKQVAEQSSPSGIWIARRWVKSCSAGPLSTSINLEVVLEPAHALFPAWERQIVFSRNAVATTSQSDAIMMNWKDDAHLELIEPTCMLSEKVAINGTIRDRTSSCGDQGTITNPTQGVTVTRRSAP